MERKTIGRNVMAGGLSLVLAMACGGCGSPGKTAKGIGAAVQVAGKLAESGAVASVGGGMVFVGTLLNLLGVGENQQVREFDPWYGLDSLQMDNHVYVGSASEFEIDQNGFIGGYYSGKRSLNGGKTIDYSDDFAVAVDTKDSIGQTIHLTLMATEGIGKEIKTWAYGRGNPFRFVRTIEHTVGENEYYFIWKPFEEGDILNRRYVVGCSAGNGELMGVGIWSFERLPSKVYESSKSELVQK